MEVCSAYGSRRKLRFIICSLFLFSNIGYISMTSKEGERQARGRVVGPVASEKLERYNGRERQHKVSRLSWEKIELHRLGKRQSNIRGGNMGKKNEYQEMIRRL